MRKDIEENLLTRRTLSSAVSNQLLVIGYWYVRTFNRVSENRARFELEFLSQVVVSLTVRILIPPARVGPTAVLSGHAQLCLVPWASCIRDSGRAGMAFRPTFFNITAVGPSYRFPEPLSLRSASPRNVPSSVSYRVERTGRQEPHPRRLTASVSKYYRIQKYCRPN